MKKGTKLIKNMTLREYIATQVLQGILASGAGGGRENKILATLDYTDELISALEEP